MQRRTSRHPLAGMLIITIVGIVLGSLLFILDADAGSQVNSAAKASPLHPTFPLVDENGVHVLSSGGPVSTMKTCGACHDTAFIEEHSFHASQGLQDLGGPGENENSRPWDISPGLFGRWYPLAYRYLTPAGEKALDLGTPEWLQVYGPRHVGGGPAVYSRDGETRLDELPVTPGDPETHILDEDTGGWIAWNWEESGVVEMNCFLCHLPDPDNQARVEALHVGEFGWANTATLLGTGLVQKTGDDFLWNPEAFDTEGDIKADIVQIQDPDNENCAVCHGLVHDDLEEPISVSGCSPERFRTVTSGQIISPQRLADTGMNLHEKEQLDRSWDIHAERLVKCTDCHYSLNNPVYFQETEESRPDHLLFDPRRLELGEFLYQPLHQFARGESAHNTVAPQLRDTMRRCDSCHSIDRSHDWLPYKYQHVRALSCESCHIPKMYSNALMQYDWTVLTEERSGMNSCRGIEGDPESFDALVTGFQPVLLPKANISGDTKLAPFNLVTSYFWVYGDPPRPVRMIDLESAWFDGEAYAGELLALFDQDGDAELSKIELRLDTPEKQALIARRLEEAGVSEPRIIGEVQPYSINHTVATGEWAIGECTDCHRTDSRITQGFQLTAYQPGDVVPEFVSSSNTTVDDGRIEAQGDQLIYKPTVRDQGYYVLGLHAVRWIDLLGGLAFVGVLAGIAVHGGLRVYSAARSELPGLTVRRVYMYGVYERLWHWLQTLTILGLLFTGLVIHQPDIFGVFNFRYVVLVHNILAAILVTNAGLALFYHLASGEIQQFLPRPYGFFDRAIRQAKYYLGGIFRGEEHPFEKKRDRKLNPLQQLTYLVILNVLLPLQILTGALMWGAQTWPEISAALGGLPFLAPFHSLIAWLFAAFIVMHVYLTTTGLSPLSSIRAMIDGWDEIESHPIDNEEDVQ